MLVELHTTWAIGRQLEGNPVVLTDRVPPLVMCIKLVTLAVKFIMVDGLLVGVPLLSMFAGFMVTNNPDPTTIGASGFLVSNIYSLTLSASSCISSLRCIIFGTKSDISYGRT